MKMHSTEEIKENCIIVAVSTKKEDDISRKIDETTRLATTAGLNVVKCFYQVIKDFNKATVLGKGKLEEIGQFIEECDEVIDVAIVDYALSGSQMKNLTNAWGVKIVDRVGLIIDIFAKGAQSREARLQVKLAQDKYILPRLSEIAGTSGRFGGAGVGMRGPGETKLELNKRILEKEIESLKKQIEKIKEQRLISRRERNKSGLPKIAIVGYTNAGKSSLLNALTKENIYADDKYFATLDTTSRKLFLGENKFAILTDTVGFISDLPHQLVDAFSSTLEEATDADLILHVVDISLDEKTDKGVEYVTNMKVTNELLDSLGATKNRLTVYNKSDKLSKPVELKENEILISTKSKRGIDALLARVAQILFG